VLDHPAAGAAGSHPALFNSFISLFKDTSLVAIIGLFDVVRISRSILAQSEWLGTHREVFLFAFLIYWAFSLAFSYGSPLEAALAWANGKIL
jgi:general L-amino acid transport system permease protein